MPDSTSASIARFVHQYRGIEGFYFLNKEGGLGYITADGQRATKEDFPQTQDKEFLRLQPKFADEIGPFLHDTSNIPKIYLDGEAVSDMELGYVLPVTEGKTWLSATLILNKNIVDALQRDDKLLYTKGLKDPFQVDPETEKMKGVRSIQQGFDDLLHHKDAFGIYKYFPVLFKLPDKGADITHTGCEKAPVRVLNLKWRESSNNQPSAAQLSSYETVFSILRANLIKRGAIAREKRLQNKYAIS